ncbi:SufE family protein [Raoultibacter massiliensis]|uniref:SufE family protein n=1 Tax=Raoultibacter massiliensis TaxID=1852371 RepID=UPI000C85132C|nr:SufE family protein [Raoultibacter massiliensis]
MTDKQSAIAEREADIVRLLSSFDDWLSVYSYLIDSTLYLPALTAEEKKRAVAVADCQSATWILVELEGGLVRIKADSEALIVKGLAGLLVRVFDGQPPDAVLEADIDFVSKTMLKQNLDSQRTKGLGAMFETIVCQTRALRSENNDNA